MGMEQVRRTMKRHLFFLFDLCDHGGELYEGETAYYLAKILQDMCLMTGASDQDPMRDLEQAGLDESGMCGRCCALCGENASHGGAGGGT